MHKNYKSCLCKMSWQIEKNEYNKGVLKKWKELNKMSDIALRQYEAKILKEMEEAKAFSWKKLWKAIELSNLYKHDRWNVSPSGKSRNPISVNSPVTGFTYSSRKVAHNRIFNGGLQTSVFLLKKIIEKIKKIFLKDFL